MLSLLRLVQSQSKSIRIILVVGEDEQVEAYTTMSRPKNEDALV